MLDVIILSEGTLRKDHRVQACLTWLEAHQPDVAKHLYQELPEVAKDELDSPPSVLDPQSWWCSEEAEEWWEDTLQEVMEGVAPAGYEFGVSENDGADLGLKVVNEPSSCPWIGDDGCHAMHDQRCCSGLAAFSERVLGIGDDLANGGVHGGGVSWRIRIETMGPFATCYCALMLAALITGA